MDPGQGLVVHFPRKKDFVQFDLPPWNRDPIIRNLALLEICVGADELEVLGFGLEATAVLDDLLQADAGPLCGPDRALCPLLQMVS